MLRPIQQDLALRELFLGALNSTAIICFGLAGPLAPALARRLGIDRAIGLMLVVVGIGLSCRLFASAGMLVVSTILAGAGIGVVGVLLPAVIRRDFPDKLGSVSGLYTMFLCLGGAAGAGLTPVSFHLLGSWTQALALWCLPALGGAALWFGMARRQPLDSDLGAQAPAGLWRSGVAWAVTGYMGLQAALAFIIIGWLPTLLLDRGLDFVETGVVTSSSIIAQAATALLTPMLAAWTGRPGAFVAGVLGLASVGFVGVLFAPAESVLFWGVLLGLGQGGAFALALYLIALRSHSTTMAVALSGMAQSVGYLGAAMAPFLVGFLREHSANAQPQALLFLFISACALPCGLLAAGRRVSVPAGAGRPDNLTTG